MAIGPRCLRCCMLMLSGPCDGLFFVCLIALMVSVIVMLKVVLFSFCVFLCIFLFNLDVLCGVVLVNCLLKALEMSFGLL